VIAFATLVALFWRDLVRRRFLWALALVLVGVVAVNYWTVHTMEDAMGRGESYDIATRRAASNLEQLASTLRNWLYVAVILLAAQVAPESRKNGTTQFVLSLGVRRDVLAVAQFCALALMIFFGVVLVHGGFAVAGLRAEAINLADAAFAWIVLLAPLLLIGAAVFAFSLSSSAIETYLLFLGLPFLTQTLPDLTGSLAKGTPIVFVRVLDNLAMLVPWFDDLTPWPHLEFAATRAAPHPEWAWHAAHAACAVTFWCFVGIWRQRHHDFGSRTAVK
jgi:hypothetical protein